MLVQRSGANSIRQGMRILKLLLWKNAKIKARRPVATLLEIVVPALIFWIMVRAREKTLPYVTAMCARPLPQDGRSSYSCEWGSFYANSIHRDMTKSCKEGWYLGYVPTSADPVMAIATEEFTNALGT